MTLGEKGSRYKNILLHQENGLSLLINPSVLWSESFNSGSIVRHVGDSLTFYVTESMSEIQELICNADLG